MMRWGRKVKQQREHLRHAEAALEHEVERERRVDAVVSRHEMSRRRNHFGESIEIAMGKRRHA
ncbi:DUF7620 family protein [Rhodococcus zopfii]